MATGASECHRRQSYPHYTSYPQADSGCATRRRGAGSMCSQSGRPETEESSKLLPETKAADIRKDQRGGRNRQGERGRSVRQRRKPMPLPLSKPSSGTGAFGRRNRERGFKRSRDVSDEGSLGTGEAAMPGWKPEREPVLRSQDLDRILIRPRKRRLPSPAIVSTSGRWGLVETPPPLPFQGPPIWPPAQQPTQLPLTSAARP